MRYYGAAQLSDDFGHSCSLHMPPSATYNAQPALHRTRGDVPLAGNAHVYTVSKMIWPEEVEEFLGTLLVGRTLHVCCGKSRLGDVRLDLHEESADIRCDAADMRAHVADQSFDTVLYDGPYNGWLDWMHKVLEELARVARKRIIIQAWWVPANKQGRYRKAQEEFALTSLYTWMPDTYFGRANLISVFDREGEAKPIPNRMTDAERHRIDRTNKKRSAETRRPHGEYATPERYAHLAHEYLQRAASKDALDLYRRTWWDPAAGDGILTRFWPPSVSRNLFLSSLDGRASVEGSAEVEHGRNRIFCYDFVNQEYAELPLQVQEALTSTKSWVFLINPPFTASTSYRVERLADVSKSAVAAEMAQQGMKLASHVSTLQFMFRIQRLVRQYNLDAIVGIFAQPTFLTHDSYKRFRQQWQDQFAYRNGFCVNSREFGTAGDWPLIFTTWRSYVPVRPPDRMQLAKTNVFVEGKAAGEKDFAPAANPLSLWVRRPSNTVPALALTSAIKPAARQVSRRLPEGALGFAAFSSNDVFHSKQCAIFSSATSEGAGWGITADNFETGLIAVAARRLIKPTWLNDRDQFRAPDSEHPEYAQWAKDAIVWLMASGANHSSSFYYVGADGVAHNIRNHFFWMRPEEIACIRTMPDSAKKAAEEASSPFAAAWLSKQSFSSDAAAILDSIRALTIETGVLRTVADPKFQLERWDAGWYQIRMGLLWEENAPKRAKGAIGQYRSFKKQLSALGKRLETGIYKLGILCGPTLNP